jgi:hypothetical protein
MDILTKLVQDAIDVPLMDVYNISKIMIDYGKPDCDYGCINDDTCFCYQIEAATLEDIICDGNGHGLHGNKFDKCYHLAHNKEGFDYGFTHIFEPLLDLDFNSDIHNIIYDYTYDEKDQEEYVRDLVYSKYWNTWFK